MSIDADALVLHHHDASYHAHKARVMCGIKGVTWHSVIEPLISPKPEFTRLTGGYQRVPMLQVGSDLYCDAKLVVAELERRVPDPPAHAPLDPVVNAWVDKAVTPATFAVALPDMTARMDPEFIRDRQELYGPAFDLDAMKGASPLMAPQWRAQMAWLDAALAEQEFLGGARPTSADAAVSMPVWMVEVRMAMAEALADPSAPADTPLLVPEVRDPSDHIEALLDGLDRLKAWRDRMTAIGLGDRRPATHEDAFAAARGSEPAPPPPHDPADPLEAEPGDPVTVMADDSTRDPVTGTLVAATATEVVLAREDDDLGRLHVHFPRFSYFVTPAADREPAGAATA